MLVFKLVITLQSNNLQFLNFTKQLFKKFKFTVSDTCDAYSVENLYEAYPVVNIACISDVMESESRKQLSVTNDYKVFI